MPGKRPSRAMAMKIRAWLKNSTNSTLVMPAKPPAAIRPVVHRNEVLFSAAAVSLESRRDRGLDVDVGVRHHAGNHRRHRYVEDRANQQGRQNADRRVALRISRLFGVRRDRVESDEGKEDDRGPEHDSRQAVGHERRAGGVVDRQQPAIQSEQAKDSPRVGGFCLARRANLRKKLVDDGAIFLRFGKVSCAFFVTSAFMVAACSAVSRPSV